MGLNDQQLPPIIEACLLQKYIFWENLLAGRLNYGRLPSYVYLILTSQIDLLILEI